MIISDLFEDVPVILEEDGKYYELEMHDYAIDGLSDLPCGVFVKKDLESLKKI